jgi:protein tyrosine/serine phosphatase
MNKPLKIAVVVAGCVLAGLTYRYTLRDNLFARNFGVVQEGAVYRSGRQTPAMTERLVREYNIKTIIDLGAYNRKPVEERVAQRTAEALGVARFAFDLEGDGTGDPNDYVQALRLMLRAENQPLLVHCAAGSERTSACVMMYRSITQGKSFDETFAEALQHKHEPEDNPRMRPYVEKWGPLIIDAVKNGGEIDVKNMRVVRASPASNAPAAP